MRTAERPDAVERRRACKIDRTAPWRSYSKRARLFYWLRADCRYRSLRRLHTCLKSFATLQATTKLIRALDRATAPWLEAWQSPDRSPGGGIRPTLARYQGFRAWAFSASPARPSPLLRDPGRGIVAVHRPADLADHDRLFVGAHVLPALIIIDHVRVSQSVDRHRCSIRSATFFPPRTRSLS